MDFGKVDETELSEIDFKLPEDSEGTKKLLAKLKKTSKAKFFVGCAKWGRKDWIGKIYPKGTKESDFLSHYAKHFNCIELNATFYRLPTLKQTEGWKAKVGSDFQFCPKFTDQITHRKRLKNAKDLTNIFLDGISGFGENLGPVFLQTPPNFAVKNYEVLAEFIQELPDYLDLYVELRHPGWFDNMETFQQVFSMLEKSKVGSVITDASGRRDCVHMRLTTDTAFIRFVGNGLHPTDYSRCDDWVQRIKTWTEAGLKRVYFFMHQHEELHSPELCKYVIQQLNKHCEANIPEPTFVDSGNQHSIF